VEESLKEAEAPLDSPEADYHKMREFVESEQYSLSAEAEWYVQQALQGAQAIIPSLLNRHWQVSISRNGSFIGSDDPVALDGEKSQMVGFANAGVIIFPVSRHVVLHGYVSLLMSIHLTEMLIARLNTMMMLYAQEQVFSSKPDFCWLDKSERYQTLIGNCSIKVRLSHRCGEPGVSPVAVPSAPPAAGAQGSR